MEDYLSSIVKKLAVPGMRNASGDFWNETMSLIEFFLNELSVEPKIHEWKDENGRKFRNYIVSFKGKIEKKIIIGAHYDTFESTPGADDNASAVAVSLGLIKELVSGSYNGHYTVEFVFYACEEPPFYGTSGMGSYKDAELQDKNGVELMICLEMVGYYREARHSQDYPYPFLKYFYGDRGNFLIGVGNLLSFRVGRKLMKRLKQKRPGFYKSLLLPFNFSGMDWSDHRSYWAKDIPAIMLTDTAMFRNPNYHKETDVPETLDFEKMAYIVKDLRYFLDKF
tara:strand:+ start:1185 stop:2027 length:843 start_codon:yes stop_codon:yes gene_type:complete